VALPTILVNSATGSDSLASGAGPGTALTGTNASTSGDGLTVTLDGSPDLTDVATDGSHVIYLADATAGARNFGKITAKDNTAKTVTVADAFGLSLSGQSWAIGGKRASVYGAVSLKLFSNNAAAGDAMPGWTVEMESGHSESSGSTLTFRRAGDLTDGPITLKGSDAAATKPVLTSTANTSFITSTSTVNYIRIGNIDFRNTNATKTSSIAVTMSTNSAAWLIYNITVAHSTNKFWKGVVGSNQGFALINSEIAYCANIGVSGPSQRYLTLRGNSIHDNGSHGVSAGGGTAALAFVVEDNEIYRNTGSGVVGHSGGSTGDLTIIRRNVINRNGVDGIDLPGAIGVQSSNIDIVNNIITNQTAGLGVDFNGTLAACNAANIRVEFNVFDNNLSGSIDPSGLDSDSVNADPLFVDEANDDYRLQSTSPALAVGFPFDNWPGKSYRSYTDIGPNQRESSGSGGSGNVFGGLVVR
jgi:hypothetical protein